MVPYRHGKKRADGTYEINPVSVVLGLPLRLVWLQIHHLYWGILGMIISLSGLVSAIHMNGLVGGITAPILIAIQFIDFLIWLYVFCDDIWQHNQQVEKYDPLYHSPVHNWYVGYFWVSNSKFARLVRRINVWADSL